MLYLKVASYVALSDLRTDFERMIVFQIPFFVAERE